MIDADHVSFPFPIYSSFSALLYLVTSLVFCSLFLLCVHFPFVLSSFPFPRAYLPALALHPCFLAVLWNHHSNHAKRNAQGLADVITQSRAFMSSTAKAKTAKLSEYCVIFVFVFIWDSNPIFFWVWGATFSSLSRYFACSRCRDVSISDLETWFTPRGFHFFILVLLFHPLLTSPFLFSSFLNPNNKY